MSKELEALDSIALKVTGFASKIDQEEAIGEFHTIRTALKALEIIITKRVNIVIWDNYKSVEHYNSLCSPNNHKLTQEEYNLINEVIKSYECKR